jgi:hypothetical protein
MFSSKFLEKQLVMRDLMMQMHHKIYFNSNNSNNRFNRENNSYKYISNPISKIENKIFSLNNSKNTIQFAEEPDKLVLYLVNLENNDKTTVNISY